MVTETYPPTFSGEHYLCCDQEVLSGLSRRTRLHKATREERPWLIAATAHPYKFAESVEPLIGQSLPPPPALAAIWDRPVEVTDIAAEVDQLAAELDAPGR